MKEPCIFFSPPIRPCMRFCCRFLLVWCVGDVSGISRVRPFCEFEVHQLTENQCKEEGVSEEIRSERTGRGDLFRKGKCVLMIDTRSTCWEKNDTDTVNAASSLPAHPNEHDGQMPWVCHMLWPYAYLVNQMPCFFFPILHHFSHSIKTWLKWEAGGGVGEAMIACYFKSLSDRKHQ